MGQTNGLLSPGGPNPDPQWPNVGPVVRYLARRPFGTFAVNPVNDQQLLIGSATGNVYATSNQGRHWRMSRRTPASGFDGTADIAVARGLWRSPAERSDRRHQHLLLCRHDRGQHLRDLPGGGGTANWTNITNGDLLGNTSPILQIITNPNRGSNEAYAITTKGVYHIADSNQNDPVPSAMKQWVKLVSRATC